VKDCTIVNDREPSCPSDRVGEEIEIKKESSDKKDKKVVKVNNLYYIQCPFYDVPPSGDI
jgi:hypothetical protein